MDPLALLRHLKNIEHAVGRVPSIRNGPRAIDLDIVVYDTITLDTRPASERQGFDNLQDQLVVPHPKMAEREFVLRPLNESVPILILSLPSNQGHSDPFQYHTSLYPSH